MNRRSSGLRATRAEEAAGTANFRVLLDLAEAEDGDHDEYLCL
jgi:hypothetical protein